VCVCVSVQEVLIACVFFIYVASIYMFIVCVMFLFREVHWVRMRSVFVSLYICLLVCVVSVQKDYWWRMNG
jgi:hypothetical protein